MKVFEPKKPSLGGVWIFSGTTHFNVRTSLFLMFAFISLSNIFIIRGG